MKIGYLLQEGVPDVRIKPPSGPANHVIYVLQELQRAGHRVCLLAKLDQQIWKSDDLETFTSVYLPGKDQGPYRWVGKAVHRLVGELDLHDSVTFYGRVDATAAWLNNIDIFISNSYWEGQQVALLEAMASGCYCLSHFWGGVEEILTKEHIFITEAEMISKIIEFASLSERAKNKSWMEMREISIQKFDIEINKVQIRQVIDQLAK